MSLSREHYQAELGALRRVHRAITGYRERNRNAIEHDPETYRNRAEAFDDAALVVMIEIWVIQSRLRKILDV